MAQGGKRRAGSATRGVGLERCWDAFFRGGGRAQPGSPSHTPTPISLALLKDLFSRPLRRDGWGAPRSEPLSSCPGLCCFDWTMALWLEPLLKGEQSIPEHIKLTAFAFCLQGALQSDGRDSNQSDGGGKTPMYSGYRGRERQQSVDKMNIEGLGHREKGKWNLGRESRQTAWKKGAWNRRIGEREVASDRRSA